MSDLAGIREALEREHYPECIAALDRVEARLAAAEQERDEALRGIVTVVKEDAVVVTRLRDRAEVAEARADRLADAVARIKANAIDWHGVHDDGNGHAKALKVIAQWCDDALDPAAFAVVPSGQPEEGS